MCGSSKKASQYKAGARTLVACAHVMTGLALCFHLSHHVKDPQRGPSDIASTYIPRRFLDIHPSYLTLPAREELINNVYELCVVVKTDDGRAKLDVFGPNSSKKI